jgi:alpha-glucosidase
VKILSLVVGLLLSFSWAAHGQEDAPQSLPDGISLRVGNDAVELRVASPHAFRLHVFAKSPGKRSIYLSGSAQTDTPFTVVNEGPAVGIKTSFGELLVNPTDATWSLRDENGTTLADWATLGKPALSAPGFPPEPSSGIDLFVGGTSASAHPLFYGSGNSPSRGALVENGATSRTGNGTTELPQYWSSAGYGILTVGADDNQPATWRARPLGSTEWFIPGAGADLYLMPAATLYDWQRDDAELTGFAPVPPRWAFGYLQSRWGWVDRAYIEDAFARFRKDSLPVDAFILDFEWYTTTPDYSVPAQGDPRFVDFGWNPALLPDPANQISAYLQQGLHIIGIRKPRLGNTDDLNMARAQGWIMPLNPLDPNGGAIRSRNLDFSNPATRDYWEKNNRQFLEAGMAGFWNDEGETSFTEYSYWNLAETELLQQVRPEGRFWSINRSFAPGLQRFGAAAWTGDIHADWETLGRAPGELLSYGLSGMPYSACDIGGYAGVSAPDLTVRWMEAGVFFPVMRSHSERSMVPHFPWLVGSPADEDAIRGALDLRYRLLPYYYSLAHVTARTGAPIMRPLVMEFPQDPNVAGKTDEWLLGAGLLAAPILSQNSTRTVYLPDDTWYDFNSTHATRGPQTISLTATLDQIPVYVRAGTLLPLGPVIQYTGQPTTEPLELQVYSGRDGTFTLVEDDGETLAYRHGTTRRITFTWTEATRTLGWKIEGDYQAPGPYSSMKVVLFSPQGRAEKPATLDQDGSVSFP